MKILIRIICIGHGLKFLEKLDEHDKALKSAKKAAKLAKDHGSEFEYEYQKKYDDLKNKK